MIFERDLIAFDFLDVFYLNQQNVKNYNTGRQIDALSFRISTDCVLKTNDSKQVMSDNSVIFVPANLDYTRTASRDELIVMHLKVYNYSSRKIEVIAPSKAEKIKALFEEVLKKWQTTKNKFVCSALVYEIFGEIHGEKSPAPAYNQKISRSVDYINEHFADADVSITETAKRSFMTDVYFRKLFKESFGISPKKYIDSLRIKRATELIASGYYSLGEIALLSGFSDYKYFSVAFKKATGVSPSKY